MSNFTGNTRLAIALVSVAQFVVVLDATAVTTALPAVGADLGVGLTNLQWVLSGYTVAFAGFLVVGGRVSDPLGARRTFAVSLLGFTVASLTCGLAPGLGLLISARLLQGLCAALLSPAALTLLTAVQGPEGRRDTAVAVWTAVGAGGGASGWLVGGLLAEHASWRWVFLVNLPIGLVTLALVRRQLPRPPRRPPGGLDLPGAIAATVGLALLVGGLTQAASWRTAPDRLVVPLAVGAAVLVWFRRHERRAAEPLLPATLLADRPTRGANLVALLSTAATTSAMVLAVFFLQDVLRLPAGQSAWYFPAFNLTVVAGSLLGPRVLQRAHPRRTAAGGLVLVALGASVPPVLDRHAPVVLWLSLALALMGFGLGVAAVSSTAVGITRGAPADRGLASGVLTSAAQVGNAIGFAFVVPFSASPSSSGHLGTMAWGFLTSAALAVVGALCARLLPDDGSGDRTAASIAAQRGKDLPAPEAAAHLGSALVRRGAKEQPVPEGHTIHRLARRHKAMFGGQAVVASSPQGRFAEGAELISGRVLESTDAWGKHLFHRYTGNLFLHVHLGLYGKFADGPLPAPEPRGALRLRIEGAGQYLDLRGATRCEIVTAAEKKEVTAALGPDPLRPRTDPTPARDRIGKSRVAIGALLMDQHVLAGIGNVYRAEILYRHGVNPYIPGRELEPAVFDDMWTDLITLMQAGVRAGRIVTTEREDRERRTGRATRADSYYVYRRTGEPCRRCDTPIAHAEMVARNLFWCPHCQPALS